MISKGGGGMIFDIKYRPPCRSGSRGVSTTLVATLTNSHPSVSSLLVSLYQDPAEQPGWQRQDRHHCHRHPGTDERGADHLHPQVSPDIWWFVSNPDLV